MTAWISDVGGVHEVFKSSKEGAMLSIRMQEIWEGFQCAVLTMVLGQLIVWGFAGRDGQKGNV